jgi:histidinol-phosphatase (PHP family)
MSDLFPADYHMHTPLCGHATGEPWEYARHALGIGLQEIGFTDHSPMRRDGFDNWRMRFDQLNDYVQRVERARHDYPQLTIRLGLEVDYLPGHEEWIKDLASLHPWDYFIGSVHYISDAWAVDNPNEIDEWRRRDVNEVWRTYIDRLTAAAASGLFEIIGHIDLPKKFRFYPTTDLNDDYRRFFATVRERQVAVELNTAGLRKECREIYPSRALLELAREHEIPITFGSDAHAFEEVGASFADAIALARAVGYATSCRFERRQRSFATF